MSPESAGLANDDSFTGRPAQRVALDTVAPDRREGVVASQFATIAEPETAANAFLRCRSAFGARGPQVAASRGKLTFKFRGRKLQLGRRPDNN